jgi:hypothetical protein
MGRFRRHPHTTHTRTHTPHPVVPVTLLRTLLRPAGGPCGALCVCHRRWHRCGARPAAGRVPGPGRWGAQASGGRGRGWCWGTRTNNVPWWLSCLAPSPPIYLQSPTSSLLPPTSNHQPRPSYLVPSSSVLRPLLRSFSSCLSLPPPLPRPLLLLYSSSICCSPVALLPLCPRPSPPPPHIGKDKPARRHGCTHACTTPLSPTHLVIADP